MDVTQCPLYSLIFSILGNVCSLQSNSIQQCRVVRSQLYLRVKDSNFTVLTVGVCFNVVMQTNSAKEEDSACAHGLSCMTLAECRAQLRNQQQNESNILFRCNHKMWKVCCPSSSSERRENPNMRLLPNAKCGDISALKITSGHNATFGQFPWMALLGSRCNVHQNVLCRLQVIKLVTQGIAKYCNPFVLFACHVNTANNMTHIFRIQ